MPEAIIPGTSINRIYPTENDVSNIPYGGVRGTEQNIATNIMAGQRNGILSNRDGAGISLGEGGFDLQPTSPASLSVTFKLGIANINGYYINCVAANTVAIVLDASQVSYVYLKLVKVGGIVNDELAVGGALKIVSTLTPTSLNDYVPLYRITTDGSGVTSSVDIRPRALGIPTPLDLNLGQGGSPIEIRGIILPAGFDAFNVLSGLIYSTIAVSGKPGIKAENGVDAPINSETNVAPDIPVPLGSNIFQIRLKMPTTFKPGLYGGYEIRVQGEAGNYLTTNIKNPTVNGSMFTPSNDLRATWMLADW